MMMKPLFIVQGRHNGIAKDNYSKYRNEAQDHHTVYVYRYSGSTNFSDDDIEKRETKCKPKCAYNDSNEKVKDTNDSTSNSTSTSGKSDIGSMLNEFAKNMSKPILRVGVVVSLPSASIIQTLVETSYNQDVPFHSDKLTTWVG